MADTSIWIVKSWIIEKKSYLILGVHIHTRFQQSFHLLGTPRVKSKQMLLIQIMHFVQIFLFCIELLLLLQNVMYRPCNSRNQALHISPDNLCCQRDSITVILKSCFQVVLLQACECRKKHVLWEIKSVVICNMDQLVRLHDPIFYHLISTNGVYAGFWSTSASWLFARIYKQLALEETCHVNSHAVTHHRPHINDNSQTYRQSKRHDCRCSWNESPTLRGTEHIFYVYLVHALPRNNKKYLGYIVQFGCTNEECCSIKRDRWCWCSELGHSAETGTLRRAQRGMGWALEFQAATGAALAAGNHQPALWMQNTNPTWAARFASLGWMQTRQQYHFEQFQEY